MIGKTEPGGNCHQHQRRANAPQFFRSPAHVPFIALNGRLARAAISASIQQMARSWPHYFRSAVFAALAVFPIVLAIFIVWKHAVPVPFWDEWNTPGAQLASWYRGTLTFAELCSQHNESRKLVPRLVYLPLFAIAGWDVRLILPLVFGVV